MLIESVSEAEENSLWDLDKKDREGSLGHRKIKASHVFSMNLPSIPLSHKSVDNSFEAMMAKVSYTRKNKDGSEHKIELAVDTRESEKKNSETSSNRESSSKK